MIPWVTFWGNPQEPDWRVDLHAENLYYYVEKGPTQIVRYRDSPMLWSADERQYAISQLGTKSIGYESEHIAGLRETLQWLENHFAAHSTQESCRPTSPHSEYLRDLPSPADHYSPLPPLDIDDEPRSATSTPSPIIEQERSSRSPLALQELMNPAPLTPSSLKRKSSDELLPTILADDEVEQVPDLEVSLPFHAHTLKYPRAGHFIGNPAGTRTRRGVRMRRARSGQRHHSSQDPLETEQFEKDGQLLLNLAQGPRSLGNPT
ncbi:uncharacterized protein A1O5_12204 [Cladophialophora psammophila CBS 110553]|uniref:Uncharacterized protein n=1 Tax=Cladophialophora psammophila CBS 110553 TaxID=1182543 RepID=W9VUR0_9EURO|nr:uncharacterized protein A1O5_12204 [Cladophialophora psammophila CBS 110553]EXJ59323.1 hypothetical protein A1O5_12204 [Cladophialophora psammophila CBS 110553]